MKHIKTFEGFVNESYNVNESKVTIQPMDKVTGPDEKVIQLVGTGGVPVSYFWTNTKKGIVRSLAFAGNSETRILVKCKEDSGDQLIAQAIKDLGSKTWSDEMACTKELEKYFKDNIKTFESVVNESQDLEMFINDLKTAVEQAGGYLYFDEESYEVGAVSKTQLNDTQIKTMFDSGKPANGAYMFYMEDGYIDNVSQKAIEKALKATGLTVDVKKLVKIHESVINEGAGDTVARDYEAILLSDVDPDDIYLSDDGVEWLDKTAKSFGDNKKVYMTNKEFVEQEGKDWKTLLQLLKSKNIKHAVLDDDEDSVVLFAR